MDKTDNYGHRERLRERFRQVGLNGLHDYEMFELLLSFAISRRDLKPIGKALIRRFKTPGGVLSASIDELTTVNGIGEHSALLIELVNELCGEALAEKIFDHDVLSSPGAVRDFCRMKLGGEREAFMVIFLNPKNHVINYQVLQQGTVDHATIYPREIVTAALRHLATGIILIHNHPSGECTPSRADLKITEAVVKAAEAIEVKVLDHLIVSRSNYLSFAEKSLI
ncbi:MAG: DNA repair protein RadC [Victivallaceae bacterium]|nr:DNA repair protein RadC [Victivallaceae bacterium]